ncbi:unnamed protein product [Amoebophrya sp. A25]|nr:unnamed protein product [Amoebophrya sp. A25]|eukprot:GSA25T00027255001.1
MSALSTRLGFSPAQSSNLPMDQKAWGRPSAPSLLGGAPFAKNGYPILANPASGAEWRDQDGPNKNEARVLAPGQSGHQPSESSQPVARQMSVPYPDIATPRLSLQSGLQHGASIHGTKRPSAPSIAHIEEIEWKDLEITQTLGNGEFGQVFRGTWRGRLNEKGEPMDVAIKALYRDPNKAGHDVQAINELKKEIDSFRGLKHKRLVCFLGACFEHPHLCFITEYMPNGSLYNFLHVRKVKLPTRHAMNMSMQLCEGVEYLHTQDPVVVHRDLKSLNVVLDMQFNIKLCDFGLTEYIDKNNARGRGHNGGSPRYMAPELFDKKMKITEKIDVWAMACIFCEIFGGAIPYDGVKDMPTLTHIMTVKKQSPSIPSHIEIEAVKQLIRECFLFDQDARPSSSNVFKRLQRIKKEDPVAGGGKKKKGHS